MNPDIKELTKSFQSKTRNKKERFREFCAYCWCVYDKEIKSKKSYASNIENEGIEVHLVRS